MSTKFGGIVSMALAVGMCLCSGCGKDESAAKEDPGEKELKTLVTQMGEALSWSEEKCQKEMADALAEYAKVSDEQKKEMLEMVRKRVEKFSKKDPELAEYERIVNQIVSVRIKAGVSRESERADMLEEALKAFRAADAGSRKDMIKGAKHKLERNLQGKELR